LVAETSVHNEMHRPAFATNATAELA
jgi:hypothetical protein